MQDPTISAKPGVNGQGSNSAKNQYSGTASSVSQEFHNFLADIEDLIRETTALTGDDLARARVKLNSRIAAAKASAEEMSDSLVQRAQHSANLTNGYVHAQPWKVLGAGAALAFLLGVVIARRSE